GQLVTLAAASVLRLDAGARIELAGEAYAGGRQLDGAGAQMQLRAALDMVVAAHLSASGSLQVLAGTDVAGNGLTVSSAGRLGVGDADGQIVVSADGDLILRGNVVAEGEGADITLSSRSQVVVSARVRGDDQVRVEGGTDAATRIGVLIDTLVLDADGKQISGGVLDTGEGGTVTVRAADGITISHVIGERVDGSSPTRAHVKDVVIASTSGDVNVMRNIEVQESVAITGASINMTAGSHVFAFGEDSSIYMQARTRLVLSSASAAGSDSPIVKAGSLVHLAAPTVVINGNVQVDQDAEHGLLLVNAGTSLTLGGFLGSRHDV
ncbi:hypothetical protein, partial [Pseudacidovorax intermedius]|uniref:hypothetical protein n=1 Tax=Pseudacidovorax intermedius TaxID=433924 RepID=UPI0005C293E5